MSKTLNQFMETYEKKTGDKFVRNARYEFFYIADKGFCEIGTTDKMVILNQVCGDGRFWKKFAEEIAKQAGFKAVGTWCVRKAIKAWIRLFGFKIVETEDLPNGLKRYHGVDEQGRKGLMSPAFVDNKHKGYFVTWQAGRCEDENNF